MKEHMKTMKMEMPKEMKETHHIMVEFKDAKSGKALTEGEVKVKVMRPDKSEQTKELMGMEGHFGADFDLSKKGKYGVMARFKLTDGKMRSAKFWYSVK
jgi:dihydrodipicolinate reductase